jgi:hypothetical protein
LGPVHDLGGHRGGARSLPPIAAALVLALGCSQAAPPPASREASSNPAASTTAVAPGTATASVEPTAAGSSTPSASAGTSPSASSATPTARLSASPAPSGPGAETIAQLWPSPAPPRPSLVEILLQKESQGWSRGQGLVAALDVVLGGPDDGGLLGARDPADDDGTGLVDLAESYVAETTSDPALVGLVQARLDRLVFSHDTLQRMSRPALGIGPARPAAFMFGGLGVDVAQGPSCDAFFAGTQIPAGTTKCLDSITVTIGGDKYAVYWPSAGMPQGGWTQEFEQLALTALKQTIPVYKTMGSIESVDLMLRPVTNPIGLAATNGYKQPCAVSVYPDARMFTGERFKQLLAHELGHCFQFLTYGEAGFLYPYRAWREEGLATYLSNVVYPQANLEYTKLPETNQTELLTTLFQRSYGNEPFFQYLAGRVGGAERVVDDMGTLPMVNDLAAQAVGLAAIPDMESIYHDFVKAWTDGTIADDGGGTMPTKGLSQAVSITGPASPFVSSQPSAFGLDRYLIFAPPNGAAEIAATASGTAGKEAARSVSGKTWGTLPDTMPSKCDAELWYLLVTTTTPGGGHQYRVDVPALSDNGCEVHQLDPCLVGYWILDNGSFADYLGSQLPIPAEDLSVSGKAGIWFKADGTGYPVFDGTEATFRQQISAIDRTLEVVTDVSIDGTGVGAWWADGTTVQTQIADFDLTVHSKVTINGKPAGQGEQEVFPSSFGSGIFANAREYSCDGDTFTEYVPTRTATVPVLFHRLGG